MLDIDAGYWMLTSKFNPDSYRDKAPPNYYLLNSDFFSSTFKLHTLCQCSFIVLHSILVEHVLWHSIPLVGFVASVA